jgi:hypothetical protein
VAQEASSNGVEDMKRRRFIKGLLSVAVIASAPIPPLHRKLRTMADDFVIDHENIIRYVGGPDGGKYTVDELYEFVAYHQAKR